MPSFRGTYQPVDVIQVGNRFVSASGAMYVVADRQQQARALSTVHDVHLLDPLHPGAWVRLWASNTAA